MPDLIDTTSTDLSELWDSMATEAAPGEANPPATGTGTERVSDTTATPSARDRDPQGRFAQKAVDPATAAPITKDPPAANPTTPEDPAAAKPGEQESPAASSAAPVPPKGFTPAEKAKWAAADPELQAAIARREEEMSVGMRRYEGMAKHAETAERLGVSLSQFAQRYVDAEAFIERDLVGGVLWLAQNQGLDPQTLVNGIAARVSGQTAAPQAGRQPPAPQPDVRTAVREVLEQNTLTSEVTSFFSDPKNLYAENVRPLMADLLGAGRASSLKDAYDMACRADPQVWAAIQATAPRTPAGGASTNTAAPRADAVTQARKRSGSLTGSPLPAGTSRDPSATQRQVDADLWDQHVG